MAWQPGQSGNPGGRTREKPFTDAIRKAVNEIPEDDPLKRKRLELLALALVLKAQSGDVSAVQEIGNRLEGKVPQALIGSDDPEDAPLTFAMIELRATSPKPNELAIEPAADPVKSDDPAS